MQVKKTLAKNRKEFVVFAMGANESGDWGDPRETLEKALYQLANEGFYELRLSPVYRTKAVGSVRQPAFLNLVAEARCALSSRSVLAKFKAIERAAGRRLVVRNGPRPLDLDLLDHAGRIVNWRGAGHPRPRLVLPHPLLTERPFVLMPLADLSPLWRHPVNRLTARQMLMKFGGAASLMLRRDICRVDSLGNPCDS